MLSWEWRGVPVASLAMVALWLSLVLPAGFWAANMSSVQGTPLPHISRQCVRPAPDEYPRPAPPFQPKWTSSQTTTRSARWTRSWALALHHIPSTCCAPLPLHLPVHSHTPFRGTPPHHSPMATAFWGVAGLDTSLVSSWKPDQTGSLQLEDGGVQLQLPAVQLHILHVCATLRNVTCAECHVPGASTAGASADPAPRLFESVSCPLESVMAWHQVCVNSCAVGR